MPFAGFHLKVAPVLVVTAGGVTVSLAPGLAEAAVEKRSAIPVAPRAARTRTFRRTGAGGYCFLDEVVRCSLRTRRFERFAWRSDRWGCRFTA